MGNLKSASPRLSFSESLQMQHDVGGAGGTGRRGRRRLSFSAYRKSSSSLHLMNGGNVNSGEAGLAGTNSSSTSNVMYGGTMPKVFVE